MRPSLYVVPGHSVRVPGVLSEKIEKRFVVIDEYEVEGLEILSERLTELGAAGSGALLGRLVQRWKQGPTV